MPKKIILLFCCSCVFVSLLAQTKTISGTVVSNATKEPLPQVSVMEKGTNNGTVTDDRGNFSLAVSPKATIVFSFTNFTTREVPASAGSVVTIELEVAVKAMEEVVVVGYGTKKKTSLTASVSTVSGKEIENINVANASNALTGRVPGLITAQTSGEVGADQTKIFIRGVGTTGNSSPLIVVDGVPRNTLNELDMNSVESYTVLKDAAAVAPYGMAGANGVILITTKKGRKGAPVINYNASLGFQKPVMLTPYANSFEYVTAFDQAQANVGITPANRRYSPATIDIYRRLVEENDPSIDRNLYANTNAYDFFLDPTVPISRHGLNISGGSDNFTYFAGLNYLYQQGMWSKSNLNRFGIVSNLTFKPSKKTTIALNINEWNEIIKAPSSGADQIFNVSQRWNPLDPVYYTDGKLAAGVNEVVLPSFIDRGSRTNDEIRIMTQLSVEQEFFKGFKLKGVLNYDLGTNNSKNWTEPQLEYYRINTSTNPYTFNKITNNDKWALSQSQSQTKFYTYQGIMTYVTSLGLHDISVLGVIERRQTNSFSFGASRQGYQLPIDELNFGSSDRNLQSNSGNSSATAQLGYVYRLGYSYNNKYLFEAAGRYDGHYFFAPDRRFGFFPSFSGGYRISQEKFMQKVTFVDELKVRGSWGQSGNLAGGPNQFSSGLNLYGDSYPFGGAATQGIYAQSEANPFITWERATKYNVGLEFSLLKGLITSEIDFFWEKRNNMLLSPASTVPQEYGIGLSQINAGRMSNRGFDFTLRGAKNITKDLNVSLTINNSFARNKLEETFENQLTRNDPNRTRTGRPFRSTFGLVSLGLFQTADDKNGDGIINAADGFPEQRIGGVVTPGSIRYKDVNGDGIINLADETQIGYGALPEIIYSITPAASWKGLDFNCMFQGAARSNVLLEGTLIQAFFEPRNISKDIAYNSWTPQNQNARYPLLRPNGLTANDNAPSSFYMYNTAYVRLKFLELGYSFSSKLLSRIHVGSARFFLSGTNLWTRSDTRNLFDAETDQTAVANGTSRAWYTPQQKVLSMGLNVKF